MFEARKAAVEDEMKQLEKTLDMLKFKCWYYEKAMEDGNEDGIHARLPDPAHLRQQPRQIMSYSFPPYTGNPLLAP